MFILVILALGIGANVTAFSLIDRLLLRGPDHVRTPFRPRTRARWSANAIGGYGTR